MPATALQLNFAEFTDPELLFASVEAANAFFQEVTVTITYENLPEATLVGRGAVLLAASVAYTPSTITPEYNTIMNDEGSVDVPTQAMVVAMKAKIDALETFIVALKASMIAAGQLNT